MEKRLLIAVVLSIVVLFAWSAIMPSKEPLKTTSEEVHPEPQKNEASKTPPSLSVDLLGDQTATPAEKLVNFDTNGEEVVFYENMGAIKNTVFKKYNSYVFPLNYGFLLGDKGLGYKIAKVSSDSIEFVHSDNKKEIKKRFIFSNRMYNLELEIEVRNISNSDLLFDYPLTIGVLDFSGDQNQARFKDISVALEDKALRLNGRKDADFSDVRFLSIRDKYFCLIVEPLRSGSAGHVKKINSHSSVIVLEPKSIQITPGSTEKLKYAIYLGPQDLKIISEAKSDWMSVVHFGTFDFISHILLKLLQGIYAFVHNWGLAIIVLALIIYIILYPLTIKQLKSMKEMQALQPKIEEMRKLYKDNPQRLNKEIMALYREHKVNPLGGCLPLILQIPVFFALYQVMMRSVALKGANFLWIKDLSEPDKLTLPFTLPVLGNHINILPILMAILMFLQQKMSNVKTGSESNQQQKMMTIIFPLVFGVIFYNMPSGLVLYWFINSLLMLVNQLRLARAK